MNRLNSCLWNRMNEVPHSVNVLTAWCVSLPEFQSGTTFAATLIQPLAGMRKSNRCLAHALEYRVRSRARIRERLLISMINIETTSKYPSWNAQTQSHIFVHCRRVEYYWIPVKSSRRLLGRYVDYENGHDRFLIVTGLSKRRYFNKKGRQLNMIKYRFLYISIFISSYILYSNNE